MKQLDGWTAGRARLYNTLTSLLSGPSRCPKVSGCSEWTAYTYGLQRRDSRSGRESGSVSTQPTQEGENQETSELLNIPA